MKIMMDTFSSNYCYEFRNYLFGELQYCKRIAEDGFLKADGVNSSIGEIRLSAIDKYESIGDPTLKPYLDDFLSDIEIIRDWLKKNPER